MGALPIVSVIVTVVALSYAVATVRKPSRVRVGMDLLRLAASLAAVLLFGFITAVQTPIWLILLALVGGVLLGFAQGRSLEVWLRDAVPWVRRTALGIILWGGGMVIMQLAGFANRTGALRVGQFVAYFSVGVAIGVLGGRHDKVQTVRVAAVSVPAAAVILVALAPYALLTPKAKAQEEAPLLGTGAVQVSLSWTGIADMDLHVIEPGGEELYYSHQTSASGGFLDQDDIPGCQSSGGSWIENVFWEEGEAPEGTYQAFARNFDACDAGSQAFILEVRINGELVARDSGSVSDGSDSSSVDFVVVAADEVGGVELDDIEGGEDLDTDPEDVTGSGESQTRVDEEGNVIDPEADSEGDESAGPDDAADSDQTDVEGEDSETVTDEEAAAASAAGAVGAVLIAGVTAIEAVGAASGGRGRPGGTGGAGAAGGNGSGRPGRTEFDDGTVEYDEPFDRDVEVSDGVTRTEHVNTRGEVERSQTVRTGPDGSIQVVQTTQRVGGASPDDPRGTRIEELGGQNRTEFDDGTVEYDEPFDRDVEVSDGVTRTEHVNTRGEVERSQTVRTGPDGSIQVVQTTQRVGGSSPDDPRGTRVEELGGQNRTEFDDGTVEYDEPFDRDVEVSDGVTRTEHVNTRGEVERSETVRTNRDGSTEVVQTTERVGGASPDDPRGTRVEEPGGQNRTEFDDGTVEYDEPFDRDVGVSDGVTRTEHVNTRGEVERSQTVRTNRDGSTEVVQTTERVGGASPDNPRGTRIEEPGGQNRTEFDDGTVEYDEPFDRDVGVSDGVTRTEHVNTRGEVERSQTVRTNRDGSTEVVQTTERVGGASPDNPRGTRIEEPGGQNRTEFDDGTVEYDEPFDRDVGVSDGVTRTEHVNTRGEVERSQTIRTNRDGSTEVVQTTERVGGFGPEPRGTRIEEPGGQNRTEFDDGTVEYDQPFDSDAPEAASNTEPVGTATSAPVPDAGPVTSSQAIPGEGSVEPSQPFDRDVGVSDGVTRTEHVNTRGEVERSQTVRTNRDGSTEVVQTTERVGGASPDNPRGTRIEEPGGQNRTEFDDGTVEYDEPFDRDVGVSDGVTRTEHVNTRGEVERSQTVRTNRDGSTEVVQTTERVGGASPDNPRGTRIEEPGGQNRTEFDDGTVEYDEPFDRDVGVSDGVTRTEHVNTRGEVERSQTIRTNRDGSTEVVQTTERVGGASPDNPRGTRIEEPGGQNRTEFDDGTVEYDQPFDRDVEVSDGVTRTEHVNTRGEVERSQTVRTNRDGSTDIVQTTERVGGFGPEPRGTRVEEPGGQNRTEFDDGTVEYDEPFDRDVGVSDGVTRTEHVNTRGEVERSQTVRTNRDGSTEVVQTTERVGGASPDNPRGTRIEEPGGQNRTEFDDGTVEYDEPFDRDVGVSDGVTRTEHVNTRGEVERSQTIRTNRDGSTEVVQTTERVGGASPDNPRGTRIEEPGGQNRTEFDDGTVEYDQPFDRDV